MSKTENIFQKKVIKTLRDLNCLVIKNKADLSTGKGIPDLTIFIGNKQTIFAELKTDNGSLSDEQREVLKYIQKYDFADVYIVNPSTFEEFIKIIKSFK